MKDKVSYFDVLGYFAPGLVLLWAAQQSLRFVGLSTNFQMQNWLFEKEKGCRSANVATPLIERKLREEKPAL